MSMAHIPIALAITMTGLLPASCSKTKTPSVTVTVAAVPANVKKLGALALTNHCETCIQLGDGKSCTITPNVLDRGSVRLTMAVESKKPNGHTDGLSVTDVVASPGKSFEVAIGDLNISLTPNISNR